MNHIIDSYLSSDFRNHPRLRQPESFRILKYCVENIYGRETALFCIDVEAFERDTSKITEIGIAIYDPVEQMNAIVPTFHTFHIRPTENYRYRNGSFVPDHVDNFLGINTLVMSFANSVTFIQELIQRYFVNGDIPCCLVGHDLRGDIKWFNSLGIRFPSDINRIDTQVVMSYSTQQKRSLTKCLALVGIPHGFLHNAGNDAYYTLMLALKMSDPHVREMFALDDQFPLDIDFQKRKKNVCPEVTVRDVREITRNIGNYYIGN